MLFFRYDYAKLSESFLVDYFFVSILLHKASSSVLVSEIATNLDRVMCVCVYIVYETN